MHVTKFNMTLPTGEKNKFCLESETNLSLSGILAKSWNNLPKQLQEFVSPEEFSQYNEVRYLFTPAPLYKKFAIHKKDRSTLQAFSFDNDNLLITNRPISMMFYNLQK